MRSSHEITNGIKSCITFEPEMLEKLHNLARESNMTSSAVVNELVRSVKSVKRVIVCTFEDEMGDNKNE